MASVPREVAGIDWRRYEGNRTEAEREAAWALYEQLKFCIAHGASDAIVERHRQWLDGELLVSYIED